MNINNECKHNIHTLDAVVVASPPHECWPFRQTRQTELCYVVIEGRNEDTSGSHYRIVGAADFSSIGRPSV